MNIGIFSPYLDTMTGGERYVLTMALCLAKNNNVSIFWDGNKDQIRKEALRRFDIDLKDIKFTKNIFSSRVSLPARLLSSLKYDRIIFLSDGSIPFLLAKLIIHFQTPVEWVEEKSIKSRLKVNRISNIICNSGFTKHFIDKKFSVNSLVLYPPVSIADTSGDYKKEKVILNVGRFGVNRTGSSFKKQDFLINVFKKIFKRKLTDWSLHMVVSVGDENMASLNDLKKQIKNFPIKIIVNPDNNTLWNQYMKARIYWHAAGFGEDLELHPDRAEHFGISTVEAMGKGAVPVVINAGGLKEIVKESINGMLWDTEEELINKTNLLCKNTKMWSFLSEQAIKDAALFSVEKFCNNLSSIVK